MKNYFVLFLLIAVSPCTAQHILVGPVAGVQASYAVFNDKSYEGDYSNTMAIAYRFGVVSNIKVSELFSLHTEVLYNQTAKKLKAKNFFSVNTERHHHITLPLLLRTSFGQGPQKFYFNAGPNLSYWLGGFGSIQTDELDDYGLQKLPYTVKLGKGVSTFDVYHIEDFNRFQLGLDIGAGIMVPLMNRYLMLDLRYTWGHTVLGPRDASYMNFLYFEDNLEYADHLMTLSVAYLFDLDVRTMLTKGKSKDK